MRLYVTALVVAGLVVPIALHVVAADRMPWWPDTVSMGIAFGACAVAMAWKARADREMNHRLWSVLKAWGTAIGGRFGSN
jgi:peptidoglycan/LPS O-acetylase OafA/YrhL